MHNSAMQQVCHNQATRASQSVQQVHRNQCNKLFSINQFNSLVILFMFTAVNNSVLLTIKCN
jgi:hypothetical protein